MDFKSLNEYVRYDESVGLFDLTTPSFVYREDIEMMTYETTRDDVMRVDLLFQNIYNLQPNEAHLYLEHIDVLMYINNIDCYLDIVEGMLISYPPLMDLEKFRYSLIELERESTSNDIKEKLIVPNKSIKRDKSRKEFQENGYFLPPVVMDKPRPGVYKENGKIKLGGL